MRPARNEQGFALISAILLLTVILGLGMGLLLLTDNEQKASAREQANEASFTLAESALNAQVGQVSRSWPGQEIESYPDTVYGAPPLVRCTAAMTATNGCPSAASLTAAYPAASSTCPAGTPKDAWGSPLTNSWTTYVRDDYEKAPFFNSANEQGQPGFDANSDNKLWVRAVGVVQCRVVSVVTLVSRQLVPLNFPEDAASGNWFKVTNEGKKTIVNTAGEPPASQPGAISMRCEGVAECEGWNKPKEQISPDTTKAPANPATTLTTAQMAELKAEAKSAGTFHSAATANCPKAMSELTGQPAYVEGCGELKLTGGTGNAAGKAGFLALADGTLELLGNAQFYGQIYARNPANLATAVVSLAGTAQVVGGITVDGRGGILFGSSGAPNSNGANLIFDPSGAKNAKSYAGATPTRNTFRILPVNE
jgi:Tfp pilus assembly protein PilX